jgi:hypothetical protein
LKRIAPSRTGFTLACLALIGLVPCQAGAQGRSPATALEDYLKNNAPSSQQVLAFDHVDRTWSLYWWTPRGQEVPGPKPRAQGPKLTRVDGPQEHIEVLLSTDAGLATYVVNTNPIIFSADRSGTEEAPIESLENLKKLLGGLAGVVASVVTTNDLLFTTSADGGDAALRVWSTTNRLNFDVQKRRLSDLVVASQALATELQSADADFPSAELSGVRTAAGSLKASLEPHDAGRLTAWLQTTEAGAGVAKAPAKVDLDDLQTRFGTLQSARAALAAKPIACLETLKVLATAVQAQRNVLPTKEVLEYLDSYRQGLDSIVDGELANDTCTGALKTAIRNVVGALQKATPTATGPSAPEADALQKLADAIARYLRTAGTYAKVLSDTKDLAGLEGTTLKALAQVDGYRKRLLAYCPNAATNPCQVLPGVLPVVRSTFASSDLSWTKKREDEVTVKVDESLKTALVLTHPETSQGKFSALQKTASRLELDFAVTKTNLFESTYEAVDPDGETGPLPSRIVEKDRGTRSGQIGLFASYRWAWGNGFAAGPSLGVGLDTDKPAIYLGGSVRWRFVSLGVGNTWQRVKVLRDGQEPNQDLPKGGAIKTRDKFEDDLYWSLAISLRDLPFFQPKK